MGKLIGYLRPRSVHTADMNFIVSRSGFWVFKANIIYKSECRGLFVKIRFHQFDQLVNDNYDVRSVWHICFFGVVKARLDNGYITIHGNSPFQNILKEV